MRIFSNYHPIVIFIYFISTIFLTMLTYNPIILAISLVSSLCYSFILSKPKAFFINLIYYILMFILIIITNPIFSHNGESILFFLNDNPVTMEALIYGFAMGMMLISIMYWFYCYNEIMTSDKFIYLFGKIIPSIGLIITIGLRFIPTFKHQLKKINNAQKILGLYSKGGIMDKIKNNLRVLSALITWSLENAIDTASSMKARGYGIKKRTNFSVYHFRFTDFIFTLFNIVFVSCFLVGYFTKTLTFNYYPTISQLKYNYLLIITIIATFILMMIPFILEIKENIKWHYLKSKI